MPQGRKKAPFSGKAKKEQLKNKKIKQGRKAILVHNSDDESDDVQIRKINQQPHRSGRNNANRFALQFYCDSPEELKSNKQHSRTEIIPVGEKSLEISSDDFFPENIDFPKRPPWNYEMGIQELEMKEQRYFTEYLKELERNEDWKKMSYFELNLETWRQLWRVLEMSDVILFIVDIRYAGAMFPTSLYKYVTETLRRDIILVLNKIDLAPAALVVAWKNYFQQKYPQLHIVLFTTMPGYNLRNINEKSGLKIRRRKGRPRMAAEGAQMLFETCQKIVGSDVDLSSWHHKIQEELSAPEDDEEVEIGEVVNLEKVDTGFFEHERFKSGVLTIGCIGQPNVGKSSLMNAIMGKKVVSVSKTPGHTKHFQTIFLTSNVRLCDCPGLVFPSQVPKPLQVLMGSYPIAQLRDPYTTIRYLCERLDLINLLKLSHPSDDDSWSAVDICDAWAQKRGFLTAKAGRLDTYRAANSILRMTLDGKICLCLYPIDYVIKKDFWHSHEDVKTVQWIQAINENEKNIEAGASQKYDFSESSDEESKQGMQNLKLKNTSDESDGEREESDDNKEEFEEAVVAKQSNKYALLADD